ncbi:hypothetical protein ACOMHN_000861 [Nucella lapillus]
MSRASSQLVCVLWPPADSAAKREGAATQSEGGATQSEGGATQSEGGATQSEGGATRSEERTHKAATQSETICNSIHL